MNCEESIKKGLCLGCGQAENNINADKCEYREKNRIRLM